MEAQFSQQGIILDTIAMLIIEPSKKLLKEISNSKALQNIKCVSQWIDWNWKETKKKYIKYKKLTYATENNGKIQRYGKDYSKNDSWYYLAMKSRYLSMRIPTLSPIYKKVISDKSLCKFLDSIPYTIPEPSDIFPESCTIIVFNQNTIDSLKKSFNIPNTDKLKYQKKVTITDRSNEYNELFDIILSKLWSKPF